MREKKLAPALFLALYLFMASCHEKEGVLVKIQNDSDKTISQISLEFTGGKKEVPKLLQNEECILRINPSGESDLSITYNDGNNVHKQKVDIYMEHNYKGSLSITIQNSGLTFNDEIKL